MHKIDGDHLYYVVVVWDDENQKEIALLIKYLEFSATTIAAIYKDRWQIEIVFKLLKQSLKVKTFVDTSANALKIQIWTALITIFLLKILQFRSRIAWSLFNLVALLRFNLFTYSDLWNWIDDLYVDQNSEQLTIDSFSDFHWTANGSLLIKSALEPPKILIFSLF